jgi:acetyl esterase
MMVSSAIDLLTPQMQDVLRRMAKARRTPLYALSADAARAAYAAGANVLEPPADAVARVADWQVPTRDGVAIRARGYFPTAAVLHPVLLFAHGGGFTVGSIDTHDALCRALAVHSGAAVVSVDYRLAPQHRFPRAADDVWDALLWLRESGPALGLDVNRLALGGDSAGATLATVCATQARDANLPVVLQALIYPATDAVTATASRQRFAEGFVLSKAMMDYFAEQYLGDAAPDDWRFSPLYTPDLSGVAPVWLGLAECDPLTDEGIAYGDALRMAGVPVDLTIYRGVTHEFIKMGRAVPQALELRRDLGAALRMALFGDR